jgi:hypothetical protein
MAYLPFRADAAGTQRACRMPDDIADAEPP